MVDKYYVYRPMLDLTGISEGTDKGDGYNETLAYGAYTGGDVSLVTMTRDQVDALQTKMLANKKNKWKSSAVGRYQETRTTRRSIDKTLGRTGSELFDEAGQDEDACYLLGVRGIDKWLAGRMSEDTLLRNLAQEWASLPKPDGKGHYAGQNAGVTVAQVQQALAEVKRRHLEGQPKVEIPVPVEVPVDKPVVPKEVEKSVKNKFNWLTSIFGAGGIGSLVVAWLKDADWQTLALILGGGAGTVIASLAIGTWAVRRIKAIRKEWEEA